MATPIEENSTEIESSIDDFSKMEMKSKPDLEALPETEPEPKEFDPALIWACDLCPVRFPRFGMLVVHMNRYHHYGAWQHGSYCRKCFRRITCSGKTLLRCHICQLPFDQCINFAHHFRTMQLQCPKCQKCAQQKLRMQQQVCLSCDEKVLYECEICNKKFSQILHEVEHFFIHSPPKNSPQLEAETKEEHFK